MGPFLIFLVLGFQLQVTPEALKHSAEAAYIQSGAQQRVIDMEKQLVGKELRAVIGKSVVITKTIVEQKLTFQWGF